MPTESFTLYDVEIPARDWLSGEETERLELLFARNDITQTKADLEVISIFAETRASKKLKVDALLKERLPDDLDTAIRELTAPFFRRLRERARRNLLTRASSSNPEALRESEAELLKDLEAVRMAIAELEDSGSPGSGSKPS